MLFSKLVACSLYRFENSCCNMSTVAVKPLLFPRLCTIQFQACRHHSRRCYRYDALTGSLFVSARVCTQCAVYLMHIMCGRYDDHLVADYQEKYDRQLILSFAEYLLPVFYHCHYQVYFLQKRSYLDRYLFSITDIIGNLNENHSLSSTKEKYQRMIATFIHAIGIRRGLRLMKWFIESGNGVHFRKFVIEPYIRYRRAIREGNENLLGPRTVCMLPIITRLSRNCAFYIDFARKKMQSSSGPMLCNYKWIVSTLIRSTKQSMEHSKLINCDMSDLSISSLAMDMYNGDRSWDDLDYLFCGNVVSRYDENYHTEMINYRRCDNRECGKTNWQSECIIKFKKCSRCRMMFYCSRKCQKKDWNVYNHRSLCFEYHGHK